MESYEFCLLFAKLNVFYLALPRNLFKHRKNLSSVALYYIANDKRESMRRQVRVSLQKPPDLCKDHHRLLQ